MMTWTRKTVSSCVLRLSFFVVLFGHCISCNEGLKAFKDGDVMLGGLFSLQMGSKFSAKVFAQAEAAVFAIDMVNKNSSLLPNVSIGYDIRNYCDSRALAMQEAYDFKRNSGPVFMCKSNSSMYTKSSSLRGSSSSPSQRLSVLIIPPAPSW